MTLAVSVIGTAVLVGSAAIAEVGGGGGGGTASVCIVPANVERESANSSVVAAHRFRSVVITVSPER